MKGISSHIKVEFLPIKTVGLPFFKKLHAVFLAPRYIRVLEDYVFRLPGGDEALIPSGFQSDGTSIPRFLRFAIEPFGVSLLPGLTHDFIYKYQTLLGPDKQPIMEDVTRWQGDNLFRRHNFQVNDMPLMATLMYLMLRLFGSFAWNQHRKHDGTQRNDWRTYQTGETK